MQWREACTDLILIVAQDASGHVLPYMVHMLQELGCYKTARIAFETFRLSSETNTPSNEGKSVSSTDGVSNLPESGAQLTRKEKRKLARKSWKDRHPRPPKWVLKNSKPIRSRRNTTANKLERLEERHTRLGQMLEKQLTRREDQNHITNCEMQRT